MAALLDRGDVGESTPADTRLRLKGGWQGPADESSRSPAVPDPRVLALVEGAGSRRQLCTDGHGVAARSACVAPCAAARIEPSGAERRGAGHFERCRMAQPRTQHPLVRSRRRVARGQP
eukprot:2256807-Rhodomonas_salina.2